MLDDRFFEEIENSYLFDNTDRIRSFIIKFMETLSLMSYKSEEIAYLLALSLSAMDLSDFNRLIQDKRKRRKNDKN